MKTILSSRRQHYLKRVSTFLITVALIAGMVGCAPAQYNLTISSIEGGEVTSPSEGTFTYDEGTVVNLVATPASGYQFVNWTGDVDTIANVNAASTTITMNGDYEITANFQAIPAIRYNLTISSTAGGLVTTPGEGTFAYDAGTVVDLLTEAEEGYEFTKWTGDVGSIADINAASTTVTMNGHYSITADFAIEICDWYDLDAIRDNLGGNYLLMNDLDSTTAGYTELASPTANQGKGWQPIRSLFADPFSIGTVDPVDPFTGSLDGQGYEISGLFIGRPDEDGVGLFGYVGVGGVIKNLRVVNAEVAGDEAVGGLVRCGRWGTVNNSYASGIVTGDSHVGGLVGDNHDGTVSNSDFSGSVTGDGYVGGLVGRNSHGTVSNSYFGGSVTGGCEIGGLVGFNGFRGTVSNSYYDHDEVLINGQNMITIGALFAEDFEQWLDNDRFLDVNERLSRENGYYLINNVGDFKELLAFGQDASLKFRLKSDLDLGSEVNFYIPYLAGEFDGNGHKVSNLSFNDFVSQVGLFGFLAPGGKVTQVGIEKVSITGGDNIGSLAGWNDGTVSSSYSTGSVTGHGGIGGLVGSNYDGTVSSSYFRGSVTGRSGVGGLVGFNGFRGTVSNSYYDYDEVLINGENIISIGALFTEDFEQWLADDKSLDVNERLARENGYYLINNVGDFKELLAFGQDASLKFRLKSDLDLASEDNFYIPYLAGEFDGSGHKVSNLSFNFDFVSQVGLFGCLASGGRVTEVDIENVNITGWSHVGGLVGYNSGSVSNSYSGGSVTGHALVGGLVGYNWDGTVHNSYSTGSVTGSRDVGGLVGWNRRDVTNSYSTASVTGEWGVGGLAGHDWLGTISNSYSTGSVTGHWDVGGLVGLNDDGTASNSLWDTETSGMEVSGGGVGKTTAEMQSIATFKGWDITAVAPGETNPAYTWNIVDEQTYPFLSWESVV